MTRLFMPWARTKILRAVIYRKTSIAMFPICVTSPWMSPTSRKQLLSTTTRQGSFAASCVQRRTRISAAQCCLTTGTRAVSYRRTLARSLSRAQDAVWPLERNSTEGSGELVRPELSLTTEYLAECQC